VRNRTQRELANGMSFEQARETEERFFRNEDWLRGLRAEGRCGIPALKKKLSELLMGKLRPLIDDIEYHCQHMAANLQIKLDQVPNVTFRSPSELQEKTGNLVHTFSMKINDAVNATTKDKRLWHRVQGEFRQFELDLYALRPVFQTSHGDIVSVKLQGHQRISPAYDAIRKNAAHASQVKPGQLWDFDKVYDMISDQRGLDGVYFDVFDAVRKIVSNHQVGWEGPTRKCVSTVHKIFSEYVKDVAKSVFNGSYAKVYASICKILDNHLQYAKDVSLEIAVKRLYKMEAPDVFGQSIFTMREADTVAQLETFFPLTQGPSAVLERVDGAVTSFIRSINNAMNNGNVGELVNPLFGLINEWSTLSNMFDRTTTEPIKNSIETITETNQSLQRLVNSGADFAQISAMVSPWLPLVLKTVSSIQPKMIRINPNVNRSRNDMASRQQDENEVKDDFTVHTATQVYKVMAGALSYYSIAHYRYLDNVVRSIYIILLADFARDMANNLFTKLGLLVGASGTVDVSEDDWATMIQEDLAVTRKRERLQALRSEINEIIVDANNIRNFR